MPTLLVRLSFCFLSLLLSGCTDNYVANRIAGTWSGTWMLGEKADHSKLMRLTLNKDGTFKVYNMPLCDGKVNETIDGSGQWGHRSSRGVRTVELAFNKGMKKRVELILKQYPHEFCFGGFVRPYMTELLFDDYVVWRYFLIFYGDPDIYQTTIKLEKSES